MWRLVNYDFKVEWVSGRVWKMYLELFIKSRGFEKVWFS